VAFELERHRRLIQAGHYAHIAVEHQPVEIAGRQAGSLFAQRFGGRIHAAADGGDQCDGGDFQRRDHRPGPGGGQIAIALSSASVTPIVTVRPMPCRMGALEKIMKKKARIVVAAQISSDFTTCR
jgi:hypothetical protein